MKYSFGNLAVADGRREERDEVHYRAKALGPNGRPLTLLVVNISPHGLMARCDIEFVTGERLQVSLPDGFEATAEVRWALGGRIGCEFVPPIELAQYYELIATLLRGK